MDYVLKKHLDCLVPPSDPEIEAMLTNGSRVVRGKDWHYGNNDGGGEGTVTAVHR